jgi:hypothetical protein
LKGRSPQGRLPFSFSTRSRNIAVHLWRRSTVVRFNPRSLWANFAARLALAVALSVVALSFAALPARDAFAQIPPGAKQPGDFPRVKLTAGMFVIDAAVAANDPDR